MPQTEVRELLAAVQQFLRREVLPQMEGFSAYNTRIAANSLSIIERELALQSQVESMDAKMAQQLGLDSQLPVPVQLSRKLRDGELSANETLLNYLRNRSLKMLEIDNPKYSGYVQARKRWQNSADQSTV